MVFPLAGTGCTLDIQKEFGYVLQILDGGISGASGNC